MIGPSTCGAETTRPSRTIANWFCGDGFWYSSVVVWANFFAPLLWKSSSTCQLPVVPPVEVVSSAAWALETSVPTMSAGPSTYFVVPSCEQATM